jgi:hypothetical protein
MKVRSFYFETKTKRKNKTMMMFAVSLPRKVIKENRVRACLMKETCQCPE